LHAEREFIVLCSGFEFGVLGVSPGVMAVELSEEIEVSALLY
jgi:hypothetical protein